MFVFSCVARCRQVERSVQFGCIAGVDWQESWCVNCLFVCLLFVGAFDLFAFSKGLLDVDVCGPSVPRIMHINDLASIVHTDYGWLPPK